MRKIKKSRPKAELSLMRLFLDYLVDLVQPAVNILELPVDRGEPYISDVVYFFKSVHDHVAYLVRVISWSR